MKKAEQMDFDSLNKYLDEIGREQLLTEEQERELSERIGQGDMKAVSKLVEANLRFVVKIASEYKGRGLQFDDLISEGNVGLMNAAMKFDASRGIRFVNYAVRLVRQQIEREIERQTSLYKVPRDVASKKAEKLSARALSVDAPLGGRSNMSLLSVLVNQDSPQADGRVFSESVETAVELALRSLSERELLVVSRFFGLEGSHETMAEIAEDMGLKRERVRQIRNHAIRRLKKVYRQKLKAVRG